MRTYLVELIIVFERRTAYIADFVPDWHFRLISNDRCSELVLHGRHVGTMFRDHVLDDLTMKKHLAGYTYCSKIVSGIKTLTTQITFDPTWWGALLHLCGMLCGHVLLLS